MRTQEEKDDIFAEANAYARKVLADCHKDCLKNMYQVVPESEKEGYR